MNYNLDRFISAQEYHYEDAFQEIKAGKKRSHWMWFVFPQIRGLGASSTAQFYAISGLEEAKAYLAHPILGNRLTEISSVLLKHTGQSAAQIFGSPDDIKLRSCMTLFKAAGGSDVFQQVLDLYFQGKGDPKTIDLLGV